MTEQPHEKHSAETRQHLCSIPFADAGDVFRRSLVYRSHAVIAVLLGSDGGMCMAVEAGLETVAAEWLKAMRGTGEESIAMGMQPFKVSVMRSYGDELRQEWIEVIRYADAQERERVLREALEKAVWRERSDFPNNPYCILCGAGKKWADEHGHEPGCALAQ